MWKTYFEAVCFRLLLGNFEQGAVHTCTIIIEVHKGCGRTMLKIIYGDVYFVALLESS